MIADRIVAVLFCGRDDGAPIAIPSTDQWLSSAVGKERMSVWTAVGMLMSHAQISNADALLLLRSYALLHDTTIDEVRR